MKANENQILFFQNLKSSMPIYNSLVDEISELLDISIDSAYRRIRGEKLLNFSEMEILSKRFNTSIDKYFNTANNSILFQGNYNDYSEDNFMKWIKDTLAQLELVNSYSEKHIYWLVKDMPPFHHYYHKELAAFKFFFWSKSILFNNQLKESKFSTVNNSYDKYASITNEILKAYHKIPTTEIWNIDGITITLQQIELYHEMGLMSSKEDTICLFNCLLEVIDNLQRMAETGRKIIPSMPNVEGAEYNFFLNEFVIGDNTFFATVDDMKITYLNHSVIYFLGTSDTAFNDAMFKNLENLIKKSTQISVVGEKERWQFFNKLRKKVQSKLDLVLGEED